MQKRVISGSTCHLTCCSALANEKKKVSSCGHFARRKKISRACTLCTNAGEHRRTLANTSHAVTRRVN